MAAEQTERWNVLRLLEWTTDFFKQRGSESARLDAEILLAHARGCSRIDLYTAFDSEPDEKTRNAFRDLVRRRGEGTPVAYLVGYKEFYSLKLHVNDAVLIPRPETEHVVVEALDRAKELAVNDRPLRIVDVGTGSGAIAIALAKHLPNSQVFATEFSPAAIQVAAKNIAEHRVGDQVTLLEGDLLTPLAEQSPFDLVCSNPPYVSEAEYAQLPRTVLDYEPKSALLAGPKGTEAIEQLVPQARDRLRAGGQLIIELSPMIADACCEIVRSAGGFEEPVLIKDLAGLHRVLTVTKLSP